MRNSIVISLQRTVQDLFTLAFWGYVLKALLMAILILAVLGGIIAGLFVALGLSVPLEGYLQDIGFSATFQSIGIVVSFLFLGLFAVGIVAIAMLQLPLVLTLIIGLYSDSIAEWLERKWGYPVGRDVSLGRSVESGLKVFLVFIGVNILLLPLYIFFFVLAPFIFALVNSYIIGRGYLEVVGLRYYYAEDVRKFRKKHRFIAVIVGFIHILLAFVPFFNIIMPAVMVSFVLHYIALTRQKKEGICIESPMHGKDI